MSSSLLKQLVTGEDACTGGAGPSQPRNAIGALGDALFGGSSRVTERTGRTDAMPMPMPMPSSSSRAPPDVLRERAMAHAGVGDNAFVDEFLSRDAGVAGPSGGGGLELFEKFEHVFEHAQKFDHDQRQVHPRGQHMDPSNGLPTGSASERAVEVAVHGFLHRRPNGSDFSNGSGAASVAMRPMSVKEQCGVRDRSTILARQLFADRGDAFVDQHVDGLLRSLHIDAQSLPRGESGSGQQRWDGVWNKTTVAMDHAVGVSNAAGTARAAQFGWADEFAGDEAAGGKHVSWADEFEQQQGQTLAGIDKDPAINSLSAIEHTRRLADTLSAETDPKFKESQFLQFVSKMSRGELIVDEQLNDVREVEVDVGKVPPATSMSYVDEYLDLKAGGQDWARQFAKEVTGGVGGGIGSTINAPDAAPGDTMTQWVQDFVDQAGGGAWANEFAAEGGFSSVGGYKMAPNNPFLTDVNSFDKGRKLFQQGLLTESVLAIEAECTRRPGNVEAWTLLGKVNSENDDDVQAIEAMKRGLMIDENNLELLLSLGVAYTNEFDRRNALEYLRRWLATNPRYGPTMRDVMMPPDSSQEVAHAIHIYKTAAQQCPDDADVHAALGVLCNLARQYDDAVVAFRQALAVSDNDYSLWNKLGATLANSGRSGEALDAYRRALEAKPNYMRGWINMGISLANLGKYEESARYYVRALSLNANSSSVWGYLRTSLICGGREDLLHAVDENNVERLRRALPL